jgi:hypothetical protein
MRRFRRTRLGGGKKTRPVTFDELDPPVPYFYDERSEDPTLVRCMYCMEYFGWDDPKCEHLSMGWYETIRKWRKAQSSARRKEGRANEHGQDDRGESPPPRQQTLF